MSHRFRHPSPRPRRAFLAAAALGALAAGACVPGVKDGESQVWGRVTVHGEPVSGGTIIFSPTTEHDVTWGASLLDEDGRYHLYASRIDVPLRPGRYGVYIRPPMEVDHVAGKSVVDPSYPVPSRYLVDEQPVIFVEVKDEPTKIDFHLDQ